MKNLVKFTTVVAFMFATVAGMAREPKLNLLSVGKAKSVVLTMDASSKGVQVKLMDAEDVKPFFRKTSNMIFMNYLNLDKAKLSIKIFDAESRTVFTQEVTDEMIVEKAFNFEDAFPGTYTVIVKSEGKTYTEDFVVN